MPLKLRPRRCSGCPECQSSDGENCSCPTGGVTDGPSLGCCACFASFLTIDHIPTADNTVPIDEPTLTFWNPLGSPDQSMDPDNVWRFPIYLDGTEVGSMELYFARIDDECVLVLDSDYLTPTNFPINEADCSKLHFTLAAPDGGTVVINGDQPRGEFVEAEDNCWTRCCYPDACFTLTVSGEKIVDGVSEDSFEVAVSMPEWWYIPGNSTTCTSHGDATVGFAGDPSNLNIQVSCTITANHLFVEVSSSVLITSGPTSYTRMIYTIDSPHTPGTPCDSNLALTLIDTLQIYTGTVDEFNPEILLDVDTVTELVPSTDNNCVPRPGPCSNLPRCFTFRMQGVTDDECTDCETFNEYVYLYRFPGSCSWFSEEINFDHCLAYTGAHHGQWVIVYDEDTGIYELSFGVFDSDDVLLGVLVTYTAASVTAWPVTFALDSFSDACANWPALLALYICNGGNVFYGACCETGVGVPACEQMTKADCDAVGGTFLGTGTYCWLEGCSACSVDCNTFCDDYDLFFSAGDAGFIACWGNAISITLTDLSTRLARNVDVPCLWQANLVTTGDGDWDFNLSINTAVSPPTMTLTGTLTGTKTASFSASGTGYCTANGYVFDLDSWTSDPDCDPADVTLIVTPLDGCPEFLP